MSAIYKCTAIFVRTKFTRSANIDCFIVSEARPVLTGQAKQDIKKEGSTCISAQSHTNILNYCCFL